MSIKILLIDDDQDDREFFCEAVHSLEEKVSCVTEKNCREVFDEMSNDKAEHPDIIFLDVNMPIMTGWQCLQKLKLNSALKDIPVIMYSTSIQLEELEKARQLGAIGFLQKPTNFHALKNNLLTIFAYLSEGSINAVRQQLSSFLLLESV